MTAPSSGLVKPSISAHSIRKVCDLFLHGSDISPPGYLDVEAPLTVWELIWQLSMHAWKSGWAGVDGRSNATVHTG